MRHWIRQKQQTDKPFIAVYKIDFEAETARNFSFFFSADERCDLFLDGKFIASGPERGDMKNWYRQVASVSLDPGRHVLCARVMALGEKLTAMGQFSLRHGFYFDSDLIATSQGDWKCQVLEHCEFHEPYPDWGTYALIHTKPGFNYDVLSGKGGEWAPAVRYVDERELQAPMLPQMRYDETRNYRVIESHPGIMLVVFEDYVCVWSEFAFAGNGSVELRWAESLYEEETLRPGLVAKKGNRNQVDSKFFIGRGHHLELPGGRVCRWRDHWWRVGRYLEITLKGAELHSMAFFHTGYPYPPCPGFSEEPLKLRWLLKSAFNTLTKCSGETYFDCPYYEQLMYVGDARIEMLCSYMISDDIRLPLKALKMFAETQRPDGMILSRTPSREEQIIPSFALVYVMMLHDFAWYQNRPEVVRQYLPVARRIADYFLNTLSRDDIFEIPGWNFIDWVKEWQTTAAPPGNCAINFMTVLMLNNLAALEREYGSAEAAARYAATGEKVKHALRRIFWDPKRKLYADDREHRFFSEHAQVMALLAGLAWAADLSFGGTGESEELEQFFSIMPGNSYQAYIKASEMLVWLDELPEPTPIDVSAFLWDDPLLGIAWTRHQTIAPDCWTVALGKWRKIKSDLARHRYDKGDADMEHAWNICNTLIEKAQLKQRLDQAYFVKDCRTLIEIKNHAIPALIEALKELGISFRRQWMRRNKPFGCEIIQSRLAGQIARVEETALRVEEYIEGKCVRIDELEIKYPLSNSFKGSNQP